MAWQVFSVLREGKPSPIFHEVVDAGDEVLIKGISVITVGPAEGHTVEVEIGGQKQEFQVYIDETTIEGILSAAARFSKGVKVKADHGGGIKDVIGYLDNFEKTDPAAGPLRALADFHIFKTVPDAGHLVQIIKSIPDCLGFSAMFVGPNVKIGDRLMARCDELLSVDFVTDPAANPAGVFSRKVDNPQKTVPPAKGPIMTPDEISQLAQACTEMMKPHLEAAIKPHLESINTRLAAVEKAGVPTATTATPAAEPDQDEEAMFSRFQGRILKDAKITQAFEAVVTAKMQDTAKVLHALGLAPGQGPGVSAPINQQAKKIEDMSFEEIVEMEFSKPENQSKRDHEIVRAVVVAFPEKHRQAMSRRNEKTGSLIGIQKLPARKLPFKAA